MSGTRVLAVVMAGLVLAGCGRGGDREVAPETVTVAPHNDPAAEAGAGMAQTVPIQPLAGEQVAAEAVVVPVGIQTQVTVHLRQGPPNTPITGHLMSGSCAQLGPTAADLQPVVTDAAGAGTSQIAIDIPIATVRNGNHVVQLRTGNGRDGTPVACGEIPALEAAGG